MGSGNMNSGPHGKYFVNWALSLTCIYRVIKSHCMRCFVCCGDCSSVSRFGVCLDAQSTARCSCSHIGHRVVITIFYTFSVFLTHGYLEMCSFLLFVNFPDLSCYWCLTSFHCGKRTCVTLLLSWIDGLCFEALHMVLEDVHHMLEKSLCLVISGAVVSR